MNITAKELASKLNLSEAAISMALHNKPGVSTKTRKLVIEEASKHGYDFSRINTSPVVSSIKGSIMLVIFKKHGVIVSDTPFFSQLSEGIDLSCIENQYTLNVHYLYGNEDINEKLKKLQFFGNKGIIILGTEMQQSDFTPFKKCNIPLILLDTYLEGLSNDYVLINNMQGAYIAANHLINRCKKQPGYLRSYYRINNFDERADGFYKAIRENGMSTSNTIVHLLSPSVEGAYADMKALIERSETLASCYFADNDLIAAGAMKALKESGYKIPNDISIIGFDNMPISTYIDPTLTTINVPKQYMGEMAVKRLVTLIEGKKQAPVKIEIATDLVIRHSCL